MKKGALLFLLVVVTLLAAVSNGQATGASTLVATLASAPAWTSAGSEIGGEYAYAVALDGDYNNDGYNDLLLGAPRNTALVDREGLVEVYYGKPQGLSDSPDLVLRGEDKASSFGAAVACAGDVNGDGFDDALIGAYRYGDGEDAPTVGAVYLFYGSEEGLQATPSWKVVGDRKDGRLGYAVSSAGDVNSDGYADVLVGASWYYHAFVNEGGAFLFLGSEDGLDTQPAWATYGGRASAAYGSSVSGAGDVDGDGFDDILVGAPGYASSDGEQTGAVYLFYGSDDGSELSAGWIEIFPTPEARFGEAVSGAGDLNGDGYADLFIGAPGYGTETVLRAGAVFVYYGSSSGPGDAANIQIFSDQEFSQLGNSVSFAGDINQDGFGDVVYGAYGYSDDQAFEGIVYVGLGSSSTSQLSVSWSATGDKADASFGFCVSSAGDVNGDGLVDLVVGAPLYKMQENIVGRAFLYLGQPGLDLGFRVYVPLIKR